MSRQPPPRLLALVATPTPFPRSPIPFSYLPRPSPFPRSPHPYLMLNPHSPGPTRQLALLGGI